MTLLSATLSLPPAFSGQDATSFPSFFLVELLEILCDISNVFLFWIMSSLTLLCLYLFYGPNDCWPHSYKRGLKICLLSLPLPIVITRLSDGPNYPCSLLYPNYPNYCCSLLNSKYLVSSVSAGLQFLRLNSSFSIFNGSQSFPKIIYLYIDNCY